MDCVVVYPEQLKTKEDKMGKKTTAKGFCIDKKEKCEKCTERPPNTVCFKVQVLTPDKGWEERGIAAKARNDSSCSCW